MVSIAQNRPGVHVVRVYLPDGEFIEVDTPGTCGLRMALRIANSLAGWLTVDQWECASRFVPAGVKKFRRGLLKRHPALDLLACVVKVQCHDDFGADDHCKETVVSYRVGEKVPDLLRDLREQAHEEGWRGDAGHRSAAPHLRIVE